MGNLGWPDLLVIGIVVLSAYAATRRGFISVMIALAGFVVGLAISFAFYPAVSVWLSGQFGWSPVWSKPAAFAALWVLVEMVFGILQRASTRLGYRIQENPANRLLAIVPGALQGLISAALLVTVLGLLPLPGNARDQVVRSPISGTLVSAMLTVERPFEWVFGPAATQSLGFLTVDPAGISGLPGATPSAGEAKEGPVKLGFTVADAKPDVAAEEGMLAMLNQERTSRGLGALTMDPALRQLARTHADDMFKDGYFAHATPEGLDPFARMRAAQIAFTWAGENLALAPTLQIAHDGLINSPGHRANILNEQFRKVGIGVLDGGAYGKMFVQEFTD